MRFASSHAFLRPEEIVIADFLTSSHALFMIFDKLYFFIFNILRYFDDYIIPPNWWYVNTFSILF
nr:MAG TPA: hypothetical protein [Caudoviricetes sp.]